MRIIAEDLHNEFRYKQKTVKDLSQFIKIRTGEVPNYNILLGAGASVTSGVRTGQELVQKWKRELFEQAFENMKEERKEKYVDEYEKIIKNQSDIDYSIINYFFRESFGGDWFYVSKEYSSLFEKKFDLPRQRRAFVEEEVRNATPSLGYAYLVSLVKLGFFNTIFTTNFDDLINEAFYKFSQTRPLVCAHDSAISSITVTSPRPKIIKLHGDYLFDDIKTTISETESLQNNMKEKFTEFAKDYGLIICGYSGCDRSIMDILELLQKNENYYKHGIYWVFRKGSEVSDDVRQLLRHERVFYIIADGFDELFAELYVEITKKESLYLDSSVFSTSANKNIINDILKNEFLKNTTNVFLKKEYERLKAHSKEDNIIDSLKKIGFIDAALSQHRLGKQLNDKTLENLYVVKQKIDDEKVDEAIILLDKFISEESKNEAKISYLQQLVKCQILLENVNEVDEAIKQILILDNNNPSYLLKKIPLLKNENEILLIIEEAISTDPYNHHFYIEKAKSLQRLLVDCVDTVERLEILQNIALSYTESILKYPSYKNNAWYSLALFLDEHSKIINTDVLTLYPDPDSIIRALQYQGKYYHRVLRLQLDLMQKKNQGNLDEFEEILLEAEQKSIENPIYLQEIRAQFLLKKNDYKKLFSYLSTLKKTIDEDIYIQIFADIEADLNIYSKADFVQAIDLLKKQNQLEESTSRSVTMINYMLHANMIDEANVEFVKISKNLRKDKRIFLNADILFFESNYEKGFNLLDSLDIKNHEYYTTVSFNKLLAKQYDEAIRITRTYLVERNFHSSLGTLIINYELAKKLSKKNVKKARVENILSSTNDKSIRIACYLLHDNYVEADKEIRKYLEEHKNFCFEILYWPIFTWYREQPYFSDLQQEYKVYFEKFKYLEN